MYVKPTKGRFFPLKLWGTQKASTEGIRRSFSNSSKLLVSSRPFTTGTNGGAAAKKDG